MSTMVPMYGFGGGSGGTGAALTVTAPAGCTVTVSKDGKTKTKTAGADGVAVFKGLATGTWTATITDGEQTAQKTVTITADYSSAITFFSATIHVTYPAGSTCTATDGTTTLTAPDTSGTWDCVVTNAGTWTVSLGNGLAEMVGVTTSGETYTVDKWHLYHAGDEHNDITGGWVAKRTCTLNKDSDKMSISGAGNSWTSGGIVCTANKINVTGFSKLLFKLRLNVVRGNVGLISYIPSSGNVADGFISNNYFEDTYGVDVEPLLEITNGDYYVGACFVCNSTSVVNTINSVWLEV